jgi:hypothetical protein
MDMQARPSNLDELLDNLRLPRQSTESLSFCNADSEALKQYIHQLPYTDPPTLCGQLYRNIPEVAGLKAEPAKKQRLLDLLQPVALDCTEKLTRNLAVNEKNTRVLSLSVAILRSLAEGYKAIIVDNCGRDDMLPGTLVNSIQGALSVMNRLLLTCWQTYIQPPGNFWQELHSLYQLARGFELDTTPATATPFQGQSVRTAYLKPLLLACANPGHYTPTELRSIFDFLDNGAQLAELAPGSERGLFVVDTQGNKGPVYASRVSGIAKQHVRLRPDKLVNLITDMKAESNLKGLPVRIADDLCKYWSSEQVREEEHHDDETEVTVVLGLTRIHRLLAKSKSFEDFLIRLDQHHHGEDYKLFSDRKPAYLQDQLSAEDAWHDAYDSSDRHFTEHKEKNGSPESPLDYKPVDIRRKPTAKPIKAYPGMRINTSRRGACVELGDTVESLSPGELIAVQEKGTEDWQFAIVRWVHTTPRLNRLAGMEFLSGRPRPCAACVVRTDRPVSPYLPGLLFDPADGALEVILPSMPFKARQRVRIMSLDGEFITQLTDTLESTFHMSRFTLEKGQPEI